MYEGWHIVFTRHAIARMDQRGLDEAEVLAVLEKPDDVEPNLVHGGKLVRRYLGDWDRILTVAVRERPREGTLVVKTILWSVVN